MPPVCTDADRSPNRANLAEAGSGGRVTRVMEAPTKRSGVLAIVALMMVGLLLAACGSPDDSADTAISADTM